MRSRIVLGLALAVVAAVAAADASASYLVTRDAQKPTLRVDAKGRALIGWIERGKPRSLLVWGAVDAVAPTPRRRQVEFKKDYSGGFMSFRLRNYPKTIRNVCSTAKYDGPALPWFVSACKAPDGSYWALQAWQRMLPNLGIPPWKPEQSVVELHVSHWNGGLPQLEIYQDWVYGNRYARVFGRFTYRATPVHGFRSTSSGVPLDNWGRNVYLDTLDSAYGAGWRRENSFLAQNPGGNFCYGFFEHDPYPGYPAVGKRPVGVGARYRITALGPGVTPVVIWEGAALPMFDRANPEHARIDQEMGDLAVQLGCPRR